MAEQFIVDSLDKVRIDHKTRYKHAANISNGNILDAACGCGYGSFIIAQQNKDAMVTGVDLSKAAIECANKYWKLDNNSFLNKSIFDIEFKEFDWLVSFETLEHVDKPELFLKKASKYCKNIICSVPNENKWKWNPSNKFHKRHYTPREISKLIKDNGFIIEDLFFQEGINSDKFTTEPGRTIIICAKSNALINRSN